MIFQTGPIINRLPDEALLRAAVRFPLSGPMQGHEWDGIALAEFARRERWMMPEHWRRRCDEACERIRKNASLAAAFRMLAVSISVQESLMYVRSWIDEEYRRPWEEQEEVVRRFIVVRAQLVRDRARERRRARREYRQQYPEAVDA